MAAIIPTVTRISNLIIRILGCNPGPMTLQGTNTYLVGKGRKRILIDTGDCSIPKYVENLKNVLQEEDASIETIILTHWHHDHVGGVPDVLRINQNDECSVWKYPRQECEDICPEIPENIEIRKLSNNQTFDIDGAHLRIVHTPGHTTDHVIIVSDNGEIFSGDCILGEGTAVFEDLFEYMKSLNVILNLNPKVIYPGHGNIINDPVERIKYYIEHRNQREKQIIDFLRSNCENEFTAFDIVKVIYKDVSRDLWKAAAVNVVHHLEKLTKETKVRKSVKGEETFWKIL